MHRLIRHLHMQRVAVGVGIDRHRLDPHLARRLDHAAGNLAPVGDQDLVKHRPSPSDAKCKRTTRAVGPDGPWQSVWTARRRPFRSISSPVAGRQADLDAAGCNAGKPAKGGTGKHVLIQRIGDKRASSSTGHAARRGVLHATGQGGGKKGEKDKRLAHWILPRRFVVIAADSTAIARISKQISDPAARNRHDPAAPIEESVRPGTGRTEGKGKGNNVGLREARHCCRWPARKQWRAAATHCKCHETAAEPWAKPCQNAGADRRIHA